MRVTAEIYWNSPVALDTTEPVIIWKFINDNNKKAGRKTRLL